MDLASGTKFLEVLRNLETGSLWDLLGDVIAMRMLPQTTRRVGGGGQMNATKSIEPRRLDMLGK